MSPTSLLKDLVRFRSLSGEERAVADFAEAYAREALAEAPVPAATGRVEDNVYVMLGEERGGEADRLLLCSHLDVVPPSADHPYDPFIPTEVDGQLYGRGTVDAKASGASMLTALLALAAEGYVPPDGGQVLVALTTCEETGGAYNGLEALRPHLPALSAAVVGEPTSLQPCVAQKGLLILKVHALGQTAHAARAHLGENAILGAARGLRALDDFALEREDPFLGAPTINATTIEGGSARNVIPDRCTFTLDVRSTPAYTHDEIIGEVEALLNGVPGLRAEVEVHSKRLVPASTPPDARVVQAARRALPADAAPFGSPTASDWVFLSDLPAVKLGPGDSERSHTAEEHIALAEVERAAEVYADLARAYFS